jgi:DNA-binding transcriptional MocR family regulator
MHNPTTRTMSRKRRESIAEIARRRQLWIIEDDVYAPLALDLTGHRPQTANLVPLAALVPERTFYISSVSKVLAPGFRVGFLLAPDAPAFDALCTGMRANSYSASTLGALLVTQWIKDGIASEIRQEVATEAMGRMHLARRLLGDAIEPPSFPTSLHAWLPMSQLRAERIANDVLRRGVMLTPPSSFNVLGEQTAGLRLCLNVVDRAKLERALRLIGAALADEHHRSHPPIV